MLHSNSDPAVSQWELERFSGHGVKLLNYYQKVGISIPGFVETVTAYIKIFQLQGLIRIRIID